MSPWDDGGQYETVDGEKHYLRPLPHGGPPEPVATVSNGNHPPEGNQAVAPANGTSGSDATWPTLGPAALHGLAGEVVAILDPHTEADPAAVLAGFLVGFGSALNSGPHARADGADHSARLNVVVVGKTAKARKGSSWRNPRNVLAIADEEWAATRILGGLSSGEGLIAAVADPMPDKDGNPVGGVLDKRLLVVEEEFGRVLAAAGRVDNILSHVVRQAWDTGHLRTMTKTPLVATGAHVSVLAHVTLEELRQRLTESDISSGFANRFLFVLARRSKRLPGGGNLDDADLARLGRKVRDRLAVARTLGRMRRSPEAEKRWAELYDALADDEPGGQLGNVTARGDAQMLRLSLTYAALDGSKVIEVAHLDAAWALWRYCRASAEVIFGDALEDTVAGRLLAAVRRAGPNGLDGTEQVDLFGRHVNRQRLELARGLLERRGLVVTTKEQTGGRPKIRTVATPPMETEASYAR